MHSMLFVAGPPTDQIAGSQSWQAWREFTGYVTNNVERLLGVEPLGVNVWLLNMRIDPLPLCLLGSAAHQHGIAFRLLPYADEPEWLPGKTNNPLDTDGTS